VLIFQSPLPAALSDPWLLFYRERRGAFDLYQRLLF
jgi:hypothetical protein